MTKNKRIEKTEEKILGKRTKEIRGTKGLQGGKNGVDS
jgi:hypothetical protein